MDITPYLDSLMRDLRAVAEAAGGDESAAAQRMALALEPAARLALMEAISQAAAEISAALPDGSVDVRLTGRDLEFVVAASPRGEPVDRPTPPTTASPEDGEDGGVARLTLRLPDSLKTRAEERAAEAGQSLNTWLVAAVRAATRDRAIDVDIDLSSLPFLGGNPFAPRRGNHRMTGWV